MNFLLKGQIKKFYIYTINSFSFTDEQSAMTQVWKCHSSLQYKLESCWRSTDQSSAEVRLSLMHHLNSMEIIARSSDSLQDVP